MDGEEDGDGESCVCVNVGMKEGAGGVDDADGEHEGDGRTGVEVGVDVDEVGVTVTLALGDLDGDDDDGETGSPDSSGMFPTFVTLSSSSAMAGGVCMSSSSPSYASPPSSRLLSFFLPRRRPSRRQASCCAKRRTYQAMYRPSATQFLSRALVPARDRNHATRGWPRSMRNESKRFTTTLRRAPGPAGGRRGVRCWTAKSQGPSRRRRRTSCLDVKRADRDTMSGRGGEALESERDRR